MDLGTAPLFDLSAAVADEAGEPASLTRSQELLAGIRAAAATLTGVDRLVEADARIETQHDESPP